MSEITGLSTSRTNDNTNPNLSNVVAYGETEINYDAVAGGNRGTVTVTLPLDTEYANLEVEAWIRTQISGGANPVTYIKIPCAVANGSGAFAIAGWIVVTQSGKVGTYDITFGYFSADSELQLTWPVYFKIKSDRITRLGLDFDS